MSHRDREWVPNCQFAIPSVAFQRDNREFSVFVFFLFNFRVSAAACILFGIFCCCHYGLFLLLLFCMVLLLCIFVAVSRIEKAIFITTVQGFCGNNVLGRRCRRQQLLASMWAKKERKSCWLRTESLITRMSRKLELSLHVFFVCFDVVVVKYVVGRSLQCIVKI